MGELFAMHSTGTYHLTSNKVFSETGEATESNGTYK